MRTSSAPSSGSRQPLGCRFELRCDAAGPGLDFLPVAEVALGHRFTGSLAPPCHLVEEPSRAFQASAVQRPKEDPMVAGLDGGPELVEFFGSRHFQQVAALGVLRLCAYGPAAE